MRNRILIVFKLHTTLFLYTAVLMLLMIGIVVHSGVTHLPKMLLFGLALYGTYFLVNLTRLKKNIRSAFNSSLFKLQAKTQAILSLLLFGYVVLSILTHLIQLGGIPAITALQLDDPDQIVSVRRGIVENSTSWMNYVSAFNLKGFLPFLLIYFYIKQQKLFYWTLLIIGTFYCFALMQKSLIISLILPVFIYLILSKKFKMAIIHLLIIVATVYNLARIANPQIYPNEPIEFTAEESEMLDEIRNSKGKMHPILRVAYGIGNRVIIIPGEMVSRWFDIIPNEKPYLAGDGYRLVAKLKGSEYRNYSKELYPLIRPINAKRGLTGSVNTASFVVDYANFGKIGLVLGGLFLGILLFIVENLFEDDYKIKFSLNAFPILIISSAALTTTLFSGGWGLILLLYLLLLKGNKEIKHV